MQTTLSLNLVVYASMTNQSSENNLTPRIKVTLTRTGILDCKFFTVLDYFHLYNVLTPGISPVNSVNQSQPGRAATSAGREKSNPFA